MRTTSSLPSLLLVAVIAATVAASARVPAARAMARPVWAGLDTLAFFTDSQATAGQAVFTKACAECHETKDVTGADFRTKWGGQPIFTLYEQIRTTMPDGNPGTLSREEYAAALAYILKLNGLGAGTTPLGTDSLSLSALKLVLPAAPSPSGN